MIGKARTITLLVISITLVLLVVGCGDSSGGAPNYSDGTYNGVSEDGNAAVTVLIANGAIEAVEIEELDRDGNVKDIETYLVCVDDDQEPLLAEAHPALIEQIIAKNSADIDTFTGATGTSSSVREATENALQAAIQ